jgi:hypothetical protein
MTSRFALVLCAVLAVSTSTGLVLNEGSLAGCGMLLSVLHQFKNGPIENRVVVFFGLVVLGVLKESNVLYSYNNSVCRDPCYIEAVIIVSGGSVQFPISFPAGSGSSLSLTVPELESITIRPIHNNASSTVSGSQSSNFRFVYINFIRLLCPVLVYLVV